jgi:hypothetical protein
MLPAFETNFYYAAWMTFAPGKSEQWARLSRAHCRNLRLEAKDPDQPV